MSKSPPKNYKINLSSIMDERGLNVGEVAELCKNAGTPIARATVHNLTNPRAKGIQFSSLTALCNGLNITPADLFTTEKG